MGGPVEPWMSPVGDPGRWMAPLQKVCRGGQPGPAILSPCGTSNMGGPGRCTLGPPQTWVAPVGGPRGLLGEEFQYGGSIRRSASITTAAPKLRLRNSDLSQCMGGTGGRRGESAECARTAEIGRASCRVRGEAWIFGVPV